MRQNCCKNQCLNLGLEDCFTITAKLPRDALFSTTRSATTLSNQVPLNPTQVKCLEAWYILVIETIRFLMRFVSRNFLKLLQIWTNLMIRVFLVKHFWNLENFFHQRWFHCNSKGSKVSVTTSIFKFEIWSELKNASKKILKKTLQKSVNPDQTFWSLKRLGFEGLKKLPVTKNVTLTVRILLRAPLCKKCCTHETWFTRDASPKTEPPL